MKVEQLMTRTVETCGPDDALATAARIMWERDCGIVPVVVRDQAGAARVVGLVTDRDVCMAAYTQGRPLADIRVASAMSREVCACGPAEPLAVALKILRTKRLRRLPVVDGDDCLLGLLSLADVVREAAREQGRTVRHVGVDEVGETLAAIAEPRARGEVVAAA